MEEIAPGRGPREQSNKAKLGHLFGFVTHTREVRAVETGEGGCRYRVCVILDEHDHVLLELGLQMLKHGKKQVWV